MTETSRSPGCSRSAASTSKHQYKDRSLFSNVGVAINHVSSKCAAEKWVQACMHTSTVNLAAAKDRRAV